jgi:ABC-type multidrug transport system ATPase subunit
MLTLDALSYAPRGVGPLSFTLEAGQVVLLCGPSGSGKSTLCALLSGELEPSAGRFSGPGVSLETNSLATVSGDILGQLLGSTVGQELELGRLAGDRVSRPPEVALAPLLERWHGREQEDPQQLSSGEKQLLLLTSLALGGFSTLILDEALSCLDQEAFVEVCGALRMLAASGMLVLLVSHELRVLPWVDRCLGLRDGRLAFNREAGELSWNDLAEGKMWPGTLVFPEDMTLSVLSECDSPSRTPGAGEAAMVALGGRLGSAAAGKLPESEPLALFQQSQPLTLAPGQALAVAGASGSGKSRLLWALAELSPMPGWSPLVQVERALLPQAASSVLWRRSVEAELRASQAAGARRGGRIAPSPWVLASQLEEIPESWRVRSPRSLSQGQMKLVACLCLLLQCPPLLLLDEPFGGLDSQLRAYLERRLREYLAAGGRLLFSTHQPDEMVLYADSLLILEEGRPVYLGPPSEYFAERPEGLLGRPLREGWWRARSA